MAELAFTGISKSYGSSLVLDEVSFTVPDGTFFALLGPSGSGKTTALRVIAGFVQPDRGSVLVDGADILPIPAHRRGMGLVFQNYALFPHLSVRENVAYGLRRRKVDAATMRASVDAALEMVDIAELAQRKPAQLSGGQQQRVALARALVIKPPILLLDEPLSALDRKIRQELQVVLKGVQRETGITSLIVTHDQEEALYLADELLILEKGRVRQIGAPHQVYSEPTDSFVAQFMGESNAWPGTILRDVGGSSVRVGTLRLAVDEPSGHGAGEPVLVSVRPEDLHFVSEATDGGFDATVVGIEKAGPLARVRLAASGVTLTALKLAPETSGMVVGGTQRLQIRPRDVHVYPRPAIDEVEDKT